MTVRYTRATLPAALADCSRWPEPDWSNCTDVERRRVNALARVIRSYLQGEQITSTLKKLGITHEQLLRALNRCVAIGADGTCLGWCALMKYLHVAPYRRTASVGHREYLSKSGYSGVLTAFWACHPELQARFDRFLRTGSRDRATPEAKVTAQQAHAYFMSLCREAQIGEADWPYSTESRGACAIRSYVRAFNDTYYDSIVLPVYGEKAQAKSHTGTGKHSRVGSRLPLDIIEIDEHKLHCIGSIGIETSKGMRWVAIRRLTILVAVDRESEAILAYVVIFRREANAHDLLKLLALLLRPWSPRKFAVPGLEYPAGAGFPRGVIPGFGRCGAAIVMIDNALIHLAGRVIESIPATFGSALNFGPVRRFERRGVIENIFGRLEAAGFQRVTSSTGTGPQDPSRQHPERKAVHAHVTANAILDLVEVQLAGFNVKPGQANFALDPLSYLRSVADPATSDFLLPMLPPKGPGDVDLDVMTVRGVIAGHRETGERPHITFCGAKYTNEQLSNRWDLLGRPVVKQINKDEICTFHAVLEGGASLGAVHALGRWSRTPHSLETRRLINAAVRAGRLRLAQDVDPVVAWNKHLKGVAIARGGSPSAPRTTDAASQLAAASCEQGSVTAAIDTASAPPDTSRLTMMVMRKKLEVPKRQRAIN